ncbi:MAG TPA: hypothetical protein VLI54_01465 [Bacillota bacterium]|nr:hypothetical protein [Bacillota bacterium]
MIKLPPKARPVPKPFAFPAGGRELAGKYRLVALYGSPDNPALGALGEQPPEAAVQRIKSLASEYQPLSTQPVYPSFEIIATIASSGPTDNGDYSDELDPAVIMPWVKIARQQGVYVVLDLQPGRTDFLTQAKQYEPLIREPNVGLALDPEWRLAADQIPLHQIGSVSAAEVNATVRWLADLTAHYTLPQKLLVLHQFRLDMLPDRDQIDYTRRELAYIIQMDGQGGQPAKQDTYRTITAPAPPNTAFGWKNFYHQDSPVLDPAGTMQLSPAPWYISYQ